MNCKRWKKRVLRYKRTLITFHWEQTATNYFGISGDFVRR